jgi:hypothetical protein
LTEQLRLFNRGAHGVRLVNFLSVDGITQEYPAFTHGEWSNFSSACFHFSLPLLFLTNQSLTRVTAIRTTVTSIAAMIGRSI